MPANQTRGVAVAAIAAIVLGFLFFSMFKSVATEKSLRSAKERELSQKLTELAKKDAEIKDLSQAREEAESKLRSRARE
jgi:Tfp pilus assembly protein PilO